MRGLRARRHGTLALGRRVSGAIADGEDALIARGLQRGVHDELVVAVGLEPGDVFQKIRRFHARGPHAEIGGDGLTTGGDHAVGSHFGDARASQHAHAEGFEFFARRVGELFRQHRQNARTRFQQRDLEAALVEHFESVVPQLPRGVVKLSRQFDARRAAADDGDAHMRIARGLGAHLPRYAQALVQQLHAEAVGLFAVVEEHAVLLGRPASRRSLSPSRWR